MPEVKIYRYFMDRFDPIVVDIQSFVNRCENGIVQYRYMRQAEGPAKYEFEVEVGSEDETNFLEQFGEALEFLEAWP